VDPSFPARIFQMAEAEQSHRHTIESRFTEAQLEDSKAARGQVRLGQLLGTLIMLAYVVATVWITVRGYTVTGGILGGVALVAVVAVVVTGERSRARLGARGRTDQSD